MSKLIERFQQLITEFPVEEPNKDPASYANYADKIKDLFVCDAVNLVATSDPMMVEVRMIRGTVTHPYNVPVPRTLH